MPLYAPRNINASDSLLFDAAGNLVGIQAGGTSVAPLIPGSISLSGDLADLTAPGLLSGVTYDGSSRATQWTIDGVTYSASYSSAGITVAGSDGTVTLIGVDPAQRITSVATA
jgi:hypothetical protein